VELFGSILARLYGSALTTFLPQPDRRVAVIDWSPKHFSNLCPGGNSLKSLPNSSRRSVVQSSQQARQGGGFRRLLAVGR
jgi:hypothetical protein